MAGESERLRVLHLITDLGKGGAERYLVDLATEQLRRDDVELMIGALYDNDGYDHLTASLPIAQLHYTTHSFRHGGECPAYKKLLREFRPHVVHAHRFLAEFLSSYYVSADIAYVCHGHDNMVQLSPLRWETFHTRRAFSEYLERRWLIRRKYRRASTAFVANSTHTEAYFRRVLPAGLRQKVFLLPYGFNYNRFATGPRFAPERGERLRLLNVGSFQAKKNQRLIVPIAAGLFAAGLDFEIHLLGDGEHRAEVQAMVDERGLGDRVKLHGNVPNVEAWTSRAHIYLHTATYEPFGLVFLEAMASGLPCVTLDGKGNRDVIREGENGHLINRQDPKVFVDRILALVRDPEAYVRMSRFAQEFARAYDIERATDRMTAFYRERVEATRRA